MSKLTKIKTLIKYNDKFEIYTSWAKFKIIFYSSFDNMHHLSKYKLMDVIFH